MRKNCPVQRSNMATSSHRALESRAVLVKSSGRLQTGSAWAATASWWIAAANTTAWCSAVQADTVQWTIKVKIIKRQTQMEEKFQRTLTHTRTRVSFFVRRAEALPA